MQRQDFSDLTWLEAVLYCCDLLYFEALLSSLLRFFIHIQFLYVVIFLCECSNLIEEAEIAQHNSL